MPWYLTALEVSRPLHFGDYGGMPLKILWTLLDLVTIVVLGSGLYLWIARRKATDARVAELVRRHQPSATPHTSHRTPPATTPIPSGAALSFTRTNTTRNPT